MRVVNDGWKGGCGAGGLGTVEADDMESRRDGELLKDDDTIRVAPGVGPVRFKVDCEVFGFSELRTFGDDGSDCVWWCAARVEGPR